MQRLKLERIHLQWCGLLLASLSFLTLGGSLLAQVEPPYVLSRWTFHSGVTLSSNGYTVTGLIGQGEAGAVVSNGGYTLVGGFLPATQPFDPGGNLSSVRGQVYLPLIQRNE
jgi:hypothetical protein